MNILSKKNRGERELVEWNKMILMGKKRYVWDKRVLEGGLFTGICWAVVMQIIDEGFSLYSLSNHNFIIKLIIVLIIFPIGSYVEATLLWKKYKKKYGI